MKVLIGHDFAARKVKFSPHSPTMIASVSYDTTVCLWDINQPAPTPLRRYGHHTEFAVGVAFNLFSPGEIATTAWDGYCTVWNVSEGQARPTRRPSRPRPAAMKGLVGLARPTIPL
jgi:peroxin-7